MEVTQILERISTVESAQRQVMLARRDSLLSEVAVIEAQLGIAPSTADIRKVFKRSLRDNHTEGCTGCGDS